MSSASITRSTARSAYGGRVARNDWAAIAAELDENGCALTSELIGPADSERLIGLYDCDDAFRSTIDMHRYRFGAGQYRYFADPLPSIVDELRHALYPRLLPIARDWYTRLGRPTPWPDDFDEWLTQCHHAGQTRPTPLILRYGPGDWNALHRDLYGNLVFPLQVVINLTTPDLDHTGGEFVLLEQRPRAQSRATVLALPQGRGLVFTTRDRPVRSARGWSAAPVRHGVSVVRSGHRVALGILFHDAP
jgi:hypothetical protein